MFSFLKQLDVIESKIDSIGCKIDSIGGGAVYRETKKTTLIMTFGPTGAGKAGLAVAAANHLNIKVYVPALIDDLVENDKLYKLKVNAIIGKFGLKENQNLLLNPSDALFTAFGDAYVSTRFKLGCAGTIPQGIEPSNWNCNEQNDMILRDAIHEKKNIVFETTGARKQEDTFQPVDMTWLYHLVKPVYHVEARNM